MTPEQAASAVRPSLHGLSTAFGECPKTLRRARQMGLSGWAFYVAGRGGVLGAVRAETAAAALGFIEVDAVTDGWESASQVTTPAEVAATRLAECCRWGADHLSGLSGLDRLVELASLAVAAADPTGMPIFAAWRVMPVPDDSPGARAAVCAHLLAEHRSGAHLLAVRVGGLTPLEAMLCGPEGEAGAVAFGWPPPYPPLGPLIRRRIWAEAMTNRLAGQAFASLAGVERAELVRLLDRAVARVRATAPTSSRPIP